jgi:hypothetical protein
LHDQFSCTPICKIVLTLEAISSAVGPAGDSLAVPMRITGGTLSRADSIERVAVGTDFSVMYADETFVHDGNFVVVDRAGDILVWYDGPSDAGEGAYDDLLDGRLPGRSRCRLSVRTVSTRPEWRTLNRRPLLGIGAFDGGAGTLEFTLLTVTDTLPDN